MKKYTLSALGVAAALGVGVLAGCGGEQAANTAGNAATPTPEGTPNALYTELPTATPEGGFSLVAPLPTPEPITGAPFIPSKEHRISDVSSLRAPARTEVVLVGVDNLEAFRVSSLAVDIILRNLERLSTTKQDILLQPFQTRLVPKNTVLRTADVYVAIYDRDKATEALHNQASPALGNFFDLIISDIGDGTTTQYSGNSVIISEPVDGSTIFVDENNWNILRALVEAFYETADTNTDVYLDVHEMIVEGMVYAYYWAMQGRSYEEYLTFVNNNNNNRGDYIPLVSPPAYEALRIPPIVTPLQAPIP